MNVKLGRREVVELYNGVCQLLKADSAREWTVNYALVKTKAKLRPVAEEIADMQAAAARAQQVLTLKYCDHDKAGRPVVTKTPTGVEYGGLYFGQQPEYHAAMQDAQDQWRKYMREEVEVEVHAIKRSTFENKSLSGAELEVFERLAAE